MNKVRIDKILVNDIITLFGSKVKLMVGEDQSTGTKMTAYNAKQKPISFTFDKISKISREKKVIYQLMEE